MTSQTDRGVTPLHLACRYAPMETIKVLVEDPAAPEAHHLQDDNGWTPLRKLCRHPGADATAEVVKMLLNASSEALTTQTDRGSSPLHLACPHAMPLIKLLMERDPSSLQIRDSLGSTALHFASNSTLPDDMLLIMANRWPESCISTTQNDIPSLPCELVVAKGRPAAVIGMIVSITKHDVCARVHFA
jgi:ankyrin repeat protein